MTTTCRKKDKTRLLLADDDPSMVRLSAEIIDRSCGDDIEMQSLSVPNVHARAFYEAEARCWRAVHAC